MAPRVTNARGLHARAPRASAPRRCCCCCCCGGAGPASRPVAPLLHPLSRNPSLKQDPPGTGPPATAERKCKWRWCSYCWSRADLSRRARPPPPPYCCPYPCPYCTITPWEPRGPARGPRRSWRRGRARPWSPAPTPRGSARALPCALRERAGELGGPRCGRARLRAPSRAATAADRRTGPERGRARRGARLACGRRRTVPAKNPVTPAASSAGAAAGASCGSIARSRRKTPAPAPPPASSALNSRGGRTSAWGGARVTRRRARAAPHQVRPNPLAGAANP